MHIIDCYDYDIAYFNQATYVINELRDHPTSPSSNESWNPPEHFDMENCPLNHVQCNIDGKLCMNVTFQQ